MNFPTTIWATTLAGTGEKPGPTTKGCGKVGTGRLMFAMLEISESDDGRIGTLVTLGLDRVGETTGRVKVFTKDCITMGDLPCGIAPPEPP